MVWLRVSMNLKRYSLEIINQVIIVNNEVNYHNNSL